MRFTRSNAMILLVSIIVGFSIVAVFPTVSKAQSEQEILLIQDIQTKTLETNVKNIRTTGDIINPINYSGEPLDFDPDKFLREFNYGRASAASGFAVGMLVMYLTSIFV